MLRSSLGRRIVSLVAFVAPFAFAPFALGAAPKTKSNVDATAVTAKPKAKKKPTAKATSTKKPLPQLPSKVEAKPLDPNEPPVELTGSLPEAKIAAKKPKNKDDKSKKDVDDKKSKDKEKEKEKTDAKSKPKEKEAKPTPPATNGELEKKGKSAEFGVDPIDGKKPKIKTCLSPAVTFARLGQPTDVSFVLTTCKGRVAPGAVEYLSVLGRPYDQPEPSWITAKPVLGLPSQAIAERAQKTLDKPSDKAGKNDAPAIKKLDPGLVLRIQAIANHFPGKTITLVSGYRPQSFGSPHKAGRAFDLRIDGVTNETLVAFCKTLKDTGCGYYPNSYFVHVDVRGDGAGHVFWIDISGPGEKPVYVKTWPQPLPQLPKKLEPNVATAETIDPDTGESIKATTDSNTIGPIDEINDDAKTGKNEPMP